MRRWTIAFAALLLTVLALTLIAGDQRATVHGATPSPTPKPAATATPGPAPQGGGNGNAGSGSQPPGQARSRRPATADEERFRADFATYLNELKDAMSTANQTALGDAFQRAGVDPVAMLSAAQAQVPQLSGDDLAALQQGFSQDPNWKQRPATLKAQFGALSKKPGGPHASAAPAPGSVQPSNRADLGAAVAHAADSSAKSTALISSASAPLGDVAQSPAAPDPLGLTSSAADAAAAVTPVLTFPTSNQGVYTDNCSSAGAVLGDWNALTALNVTVTAAQAATDAAPSVLNFAVDLPDPVKIALAVVQGVLQGTQLALQQTEQVAYDCYTQVYNATTQTVYPMDSQGNFITASSQASVDALTLKENDINSIVGQITTTATRVSANLDTLINSLGAVQGTADTINSTVTTINTKAATLITNLQTAQSTANTINGKADTTITNIASFEQLSLQMDIEAALSEPSNKPMALFQLPQSLGGELETVRDTVSDTITLEQQAGQPINNAQATLASGNQALAAGQYENAYTLYAQAYRAAVK
jgi:hypothetical protein